jgi:hypothetical protein
MRGTLAALTLGSVLLSGCYIYPVRERVVDREVVDQNGYVVERERVYAHDVPPPPRVEVVPVAPYFGAVWVQGFWALGHHHRWFWVPGHWR